MTIKVKYSNEQAKVIKVTYDTTPVYISTSVSAVYVKVLGVDESGAYVPYNLATKNVNLGEYGLSAGYLQVDTTPTNTPDDQGTMYWDADAETVALIMNGTVQKIGEDLFFHVQNKTGSPIPKGTCVRFDGTDGNSGKLLIAPFIANGSYPSQYFMGVTAETINNGSFGKVYHFGKIRGVNTNAYNASDILYASTTVAGGFQTTAPTAPNNIIIVAAVITKSNNGTLMIRSTLGSNINNDEGVKFTNSADGEMIIYDGGQSLWVNTNTIDFGQW